MSATLQIVDIDEGLLTSIARQPQFVSTFPFLSHLSGNLRVAPRHPREHCSKCSMSNQLRIMSFNMTKANVAALSGDKLNEFKQMIGAKQIRVRYLDGRKLQEKII